MDEAVSRKSEQQGTEESGAAGTIGGVEEQRHSPIASEEEEASPRSSGARGSGKLDRQRRAATVRHRRPEKTLPTMKFTARNHSFQDVADSYWPVLASAQRSGESETEGSAVETCK